MARKSVNPPKNNMESSTNEQIINKHLMDGYDVDTIFFLLSRQKRNIQFIKNDQERADFAAKYEMPEPKFDKLGRQRLMEQIRKCKHAYSKTEQNIDVLRSLSKSDGKAYHVSELDIVNIPRFSLGIPELDAVLGVDSITRETGTPEGSCTIVGAPKGVGKTRLTVMISSFVGAPNAKPNSRGDNGVLYIQNEENLEGFRSRYAKMWTNKHNIHLSDSNDLIQQVALVNARRPKLVVVDSLQDTLQAKHPGGAASVLTAYKSIAETNGTAFWIISHVNGKGGIKGGTYAGHKVDIELLLERGFASGEFIVNCSEKNRYGPSGKSAMFRHTDEGVEVVKAEVYDYRVSSKSLDSLETRKTGMTVIGN